MSRFSPVIAWAILHRQRLARVVLVAAVCFGATRIWPQVPRTTDLRVGLGTQHLEIMELHVEIARDGEHVQTLSYRFPKGAPAVIQHELMLPTGRYEVQVRCRRKSGVTAVERMIELPSADVLRLDATGDQA